MSLSPDQFKATKPFTVITQHGEGRKVRRARFSTYEEAKAHGEAINPETDPTMVPNLDDKHLHGKTYESGLFWFGNRYGAIHQKRPAGYRE